MSRYRKPRRMDRYSRRLVRWSTGLGIALLVLAVFVAVQTVPAANLPVDPGSEFAAGNTGANKGAQAQGQNGNPPGGNNPPAGNNPSGANNSPGGNNPPGGNPPGGEGPSGGDKPPKPYCKPDKPKCK